jgi:hypothetical protein
LQCLDQREMAAAVKYIIINQLSLVGSKSSEIQ